MDRFGHPEEIAAGARWRLSEQASFATGANLPIDSGFFPPYPAANTRETKN